MLTMKTVPYTRFHLPLGRKTTEYIDISDAAAIIYDNIVSCGCMLTMEVLRNGSQISICVEQNEFGDFDCRVHPLDSNLDLHFERMILDFKEENFDKWIKQFSNE